MACFKQTSKEFIEVKSVGQLLMIMYYTSWYLTLESVKDA